MNFPVVRTAMSGMVAAWLVSGPRGMLANP
jgi:hypothetical protein